jgi:DNA replication protein DnaC
MKKEVLIEEIIKSVKETKATVEGAQYLVNQILSFRKTHKNNGLITFNNNKEIDNLLARYTTNNNIDKIIDGFTGKEKINSGKFEKIRSEFLKILTEVQVQINKTHK